MSTLPEKPVSIFPLQSIRFACSKGLVFALDGLELKLGKLVGTSNRTNDTQFSVHPSKANHDTPYLVTISIEFLRQIIKTRLKSNPDI